MLNIDYRRGFFRRHILPKTILGRLILLILIPVLLVQIFSLLAFSIRHTNHTTEVLSQQIISEMNLFIKTNEFNPKLAKSNANDLGMKVEVVKLQSTTNEQSVDRIGKRFVREFNRIKPYYLKDFTPYIRYVKPRNVVIYMVSDNITYKFIVDEYRLYTNVSGQTVWFMTIVGGLIALILALGIARNQAVPIRKLSKSIISFSRGNTKDIQDLDIRGSNEVRQAIYNFKIMAGRIKRHNEQRTNMLSGISHDLRTPLTRMKLLLAMAEKNQVNNDINDNIKDMEKMIESYLDFAKGVKDKAPENISVNTLIEDVVKKWKKSGKDININLIKDSNINVSPENINRVFDNIISNSFKYGDTVNIEIDNYEKGYTAIKIIDNGTGIPDDKLKEVINPFFRVDESRNAEIEGVGLGLSIAYDITTYYGGELHLANNKDGKGLTVTIILPKAV
ncbi:MAG: sensor histidine kinase [Alphaproteobacteria bacterium]